MGGLVGHREGGVRRALEGVFDACLPEDDVRVRGGALVHVRL